MLISISSEGVIFEESNFVNQSVSLGLTGRKHLDRGNVDVVVHGMQVNRTDWLRVVRLLSQSGATFQDDGFKSLE